MHYFVDGYNLLFRVLRAGSDLQKQRQDFIEDLNVKAEALNLDLTIVFDGTHQPGELSRSHFKHLEIIFTGKGETADDYILNALKQCMDPRHQTVITSDNRLAWRSRRKSAQTETVESFVSSVNNRYKKKQLPENQLTVLKQKKSVLKKSDRDTGSESCLIPTPIPKGASVEECFDHYLSLFEKGFQEQVETKKIKIKKTSSSRSKKNLIKTPKQAVKDIPDTERWLKAFQRDMKDE